MKVYRYIITNVPLDKQEEVHIMLYELIKKGIIKVLDVHFREEDEI